MRAYRPSGKVSILGIPILIIAALLTGLLVGGLAFFISFQFNLFLICVFPLIMGFLGGVIMVAAVRVGKVRNPLLAGLFGLLAGIAILAVFRGGEYYFTWIHEGAMRTAARQNREASEQEIILQSIPIGLEDVTADDFMDFNKRLAEFGTSISYRSTNIELDETQTWILWGVEALAIVALCAGLAFGPATEPFNERANRWYRDWQWFGSVPFGKKKEFIDKLKQGDFKGAGALMTTGTLPLPNVKVDLTGDDTDSEGDWLLKIDDARQGRNGVEYSNITVGLLTPQELSILRSTMPGSNPQ